MNDQPTCARCPAFVFTAESIAARLCHGCRSPRPEMRIDSPPIHRSAPVCIRVVNVKGMNKPDQRAGICYVGRRFAGWKEHALANPFKYVPGDVTIYPALVRYGWHLRVMPDLDAKLAELWEQCERGAKPLGCWCVNATAGDGSAVVCHAQILAEHLRERFCVA